MDAREVAGLIDEGKIRTASELKKVSKSIRYSEILKFVKKNSSKKLLMLKPTRALSGVSVIAVMCKPHTCPGKCIYCPKGENAPQSYTGKEPAAMRAINNDYDPAKQVRDRLMQYEATGHDASKVEIVIMGGTFLSMPVSYQDSFIKGIYQALNGTTTDDLKKLKEENEVSRHRCVAMTVETRPDICSDDDIKRMLEYGVTRVELGCQSVYDDVLENVGRGHDTDCTKDAIKRLKDAGFKVDLHIMIGLPGSSSDRDIEMFDELFGNEDYKPDGLKIYPTLVIKGTKLYDMWKQGLYKPLTDEEAAFIISRGLMVVPLWVRIKRVMRDIPSTVISAGPRKSNLRELAWNLMEEECNCIRCRETGRKRKAFEPVLSIVKYRASGGEEYFISYEDFLTGALVGFARLRLGKEAYLRELHVYGSETPFGMRGEWQHRGYGRRLLKEAEDIAFGNYKKLKVLSGVGVRGYYKRQGYVLEGNYMVKYNNK